MYLHVQKDDHIYQSFNVIFIQTMISISIYECCTFKVVSIVVEISPLNVRLEGIIQMDILCRRGPLMYLDGRLVWFDRRSQPVITHLDGTFAATLSFSPSTNREHNSNWNEFNEAEIMNRDFPETLAFTTRVKSATYIRVVPRDIKPGDIKVFSLMIIMM